MQKKVTSDGDAWVCLTHEKVVPEKRAVASLVLDDGTESIRAVLYFMMLWASWE